MDMRTSSQPAFMYWPTKVNVSEGIESLYDFEYIDRNDTKVSTVYISKEDILPEILSVDLKRVWEDAVTETSTALKTQIFRTIVTYTETIEKTYIETMIYETYETYVVTPSPITTATKETFTTPPTSTTTLSAITPTATPSPIPSIDMLGFEILIFAIVAAVVGFAVGLTIRRRRKPEAPYVPPPLPSPI